jgi:hypothetical protein
VDVHGVRRTRNHTHARMLATAAASAVRLSANHNNCCACTQELRETRQSHGAPAITRTETPEHRANNSRDKATFDPDRPRWACQIPCVVVLSMVATSMYPNSNRLHCVRAYLHGQR